jgi:hypothetical protein
METKTRTEQILKVMTILVWIVFIGSMIKAGAILISFGVSAVNPEGAKNLYKGLNLYSLRQFSFWHYTLYVSLMFALSGMIALMSYLLIKSLSKVNLMAPFRMVVALIIERISYVLLGMWLIELVSSIHSTYLFKVMGEQYGQAVTGEFLFLAGLVFIIAQIFKRGVEIQSENELTV